MTVVDPGERAVVREVMAGVLDLQQEFSASNTDAMQLRGLLIRDDGPEWIRNQLPQLTGEMPASAKDLSVQGKDGMGQKTLIPWIRLFSEEHSPRATHGFYAVYLFDRSGEVVYLALNQGTTVWDGIGFPPQDPKVLAERVSWARSVLTEESTDDLLRTIDLKGTQLADGYERGNIFAVRYARETLPSNEKLASDLARMATMLGRIYAAEDSGWVPGELAPEVADVLAALDEARTGTEKSGGFRSSAAERQAIEHRAMEVAREVMAVEGWTKILDCHSNSPFDFTAEHAGNRLFVEVKGTSSSGKEVILTQGEVEHMRRHHPHTVLISSMAYTSEARLTNLSHRGALPGSPPPGQSQTMTSGRLHTAT